MQELNFKPLTAEQIEVRPTATNVKGKCTLLLYINSRCAAQIMNETVGVMNWQIEYKDVGGTIYGRLSVYDSEKGQWISKEDTGSEGNIEAEKSLSSDILKRTIARWGCDYLYYTPKINISCPESYYYNGKMTMTFNVNEIVFEGKKCVRLVIADRFGNIAFNFDANKPQQAQQQHTPTAATQQPKEQPTENGLIPKQLYAKTANAATVDELQTIWNDNSEWHINRNFVQQVKKKKAALTA